MNNSIKASPTFYEQVILSFIDKHQITNLFDIGVGPKTEYLTISKKYPSIRFFGIEAHPETFKKVEKVFPGPVLNMAIAEGGIGTKVNYFVHEQNVMASGLLPYETAPKSPKIKVNSITLDLFDEKFDSVDNILLWMDIEGYELKALKSGKKLMRSGRVKLLNLEVRRKWNNKSEGCTEAEIDRELAKYNYKKIFVYNHYPQSHHHDAIYVHESYVLPKESRDYTDLYNELSSDIKRKTAYDAAYAVIDAYISIREHKDKIAYLRSKIAEIK